MMDADVLYPRGFHPVRHGRDRGGSERIVPLSRAHAPVRYYLADFGLSSQSRAWVTGLDGRDQQVPELSDEVPYDPYKTDIFILGNMLRMNFYNVCDTSGVPAPLLTELVQVYSNVGFLKPLISRMTRHDPAQRPTSAEAEQVWHRIRPQISELHKSWRLTPREEPWLITVLIDGARLVGRGYHAGKQIARWFTEAQG